jgi:atypical dual specificity phosphatase
MKLKLEKGCLQLYFDNIPQFLSSYLNHIPNDLITKQNTFHITVINHDELSEEKYEMLSHIISDDNELHVIDLGLGKINYNNNDVFYVQVYNTNLNKIRKIVGLPDKHFHIVFGVKDINIIETNFNNIYILPANLEENIKLFFTTAKDIMENITLANWLYSKFPNNMYLISLLAKYYANQKNFTASRELCQKLIDNNNITGYFIFLKIDSLHHIDYDLISEIEFDNSLKHEAEYVASTLNKKIEYGLNKTYFFFYIKPQTDKTMILVKYELPFNFSIIETNKLAGSSMPKDNDLEIFEKLGITDVITCMENKHPSDFSKFKLTDHFFEIKDRYPPSIEQMDEMCSIIKTSGNTVVHCLGGIGRTNTVLICYLIRYSINKMSINEVIDHVTQLRPNIKLTNSQKEFIKTYAAHCHINKGLKIPYKILMFVGYPGSGKSTLCEHIAKYLSSDTVRINQDDLRGKSTCFDAFNDNIKNDKIILLDNTNLTKEKRKEYIDCSFKKKILCIFMNTPIEECQYGIDTRKNHPTVRPGSKVLTQCDKLQLPELSEGFTKIVTIDNKSDFYISNLLSLLGINEKLTIINEQDVHLIKFPRTRHLINLGSATKDDRLFSPEEQKLFLNWIVYIEEKVDGANLGISIDKDYKIYVQNRSHYITSNYHAQFKPLDKWLEKHKSCLFEILEPDVEILYGEWLYLKHSIHYEKLPDYFIAFDIYNRKTKTFLSRNALEKRLSTTTIQQVPLIEKRIFTKLDDFKSLMKLKSKFYDGLIEGVYLRLCNDESTIQRAKIVRSDFICGNTHWKNNKHEINKLVF